jgi:signal transduction histidine kinase
VKQDKNIISETLEGDQRGLIYWVGDPQGEQRAIVTEAHAITRASGERLGSAVVTYDVTDLANAIEIREEYLATVSHELRTPLTSIVGYLDLIDDGYDIDSLGFAKEFRNIQRSANQMLTLIRDLLSTSTSELALRIEPIDLSSLLAQSVSTFQPTIDVARQTLQLEMPHSTVLAHLDGARIKQVVDNLISNAAKYTPDGGTITVTLERGDDTVAIVVADNGRGINKTDQARLFDRFFRTRDVREAAIQGVGIGLTIVKTIVDAHGGTIQVESEPGHGSTFRVTLPARAVSTPLPTLPMEP